MSRWNAYGLACRWSDNNAFGGCLEWSTELTRTETSIIPTVIDNQPEGEMFTYNRAGMSIFTGYFGVQSSPFADKMNLVYGTDGKVYIQNPLWWNKSFNTWICGDFDPETGIISVPVGQYLMYNEQADMGVQLLWGHSIIYQDENGYYMYEYFIDDVDNIQYRIDGENIYLLGCEGDPNAEFPDYYNATGLLGHFSDGSNMTCLEYVGPDVPYGTLLNLEPAVPANPAIVTWQDRGETDGTTYLGFTLPTTDVDGNYIDQYYMSYSIFLDDDRIYTFKANDFPNELNEDVTEIPTSIFFNSWNMSTYGAYLYYDEAPLFTHQVGIQVYYTIDGERNASDIVYLEVFPDTGVDELNATKQIANVRYYNMAGQEMAQPNGMTIKVTTYTDGTRTAAKIIK